MLLHTLKGNKPIGGTLSVWSPDGKLLGTRSNEGAILLWDPLNGKLLHTLPMPEAQTLL